MKVEILFTKRDAFISNSIALATGCEVSHVLIKIGDNVWEARGDKPYSQVIKQKYTDMMNDSKITAVYSREIFVYDIEDAIKWLDSKVGVGYDYTNTGILQPLKLIFNRLFWQKKDSSADDKYQCAEYVAHFVKLQCINSWIAKPIASYSPKDHFVIIKPVKIYEKN